MMKRKIAIVLCLFCLIFAAASADKARYLSTDGNSSYHVSHLDSHTGLIDCRISANYLKVRTSPGGSNVLGHVEQADTIELIELNGRWAQIRVTYSAPTSPDSWTGLQGWVDADYVECPCSYSEYYGSFSGSYPDGVIDNSGTNVRELAGQSARTLFTLSRGKNVVVLGSYQGSGGEFYRILVDGKTGFVRSDMVSYTGSYTTPVADEGLPSKGGIGADPGMPTYVPNGAAMGELLHDSTNVRQSANGTVSGRLRKGTVVAILSDTTSQDGVLWYYVSYGNNQRGYIRADLIEITGMSSGNQGLPYNYYTPTATPVPYYYNTATPVPYYYNTATPVPYYYNTATPVPYYYKTATPAPATTAAPGSGYRVDYASIYNAYVRSNWNGYATVGQTKIQDMDGDGVPEFFLWADTGARGAVYIYTYNNGYVVPLNTDYRSGTSTSVAGTDKENNVIGGGGDVYFAEYGIGILSGGSDSASESSYGYYLKSGYALVQIRSLEIRRTYYSTTYVLDGRTVTADDVRQFLSAFPNAASQIL